MISPGDIYVVVTDGVTEAKSAAGEQFGQERVLAIVRENSGRPAARIIDAINRSVETFCGSS